MIIFFSEYNDCEASFYFAGLLAGDGCVVRDNRYKKTKMNNIVSISLKQDDESILIKFKSFANIEKKLYYNKGKCILQFVSDQICIDLKQRFNIGPNKTNIYNFPEWLKEHKLVNHFIRGYLDADGCFTIPKINKKCKDGSERIPQVYFNVAGTYNFISDCKDLLNVNCSILKDKKVVKSKGCFIVSYGGNKIIEKIADFIYREATIFLQRKYDKAMMAKEFTKQAQIQKEKDIIKRAKIRAEKQKIKRRY
jgi:hypothetical protein